MAVKRSQSQSRISASDSGSRAKVDRSTGGRKRASASTQVTERQLKGSSSASSQELAMKRARLLADWFAAHQRDLPWRRNPEPYRVWISEIMLQQTQVATVVPYFERFVERFPNPASLAAADEAEVLRYWEGLGYYRRARSLHAGAKVIVDRYTGRFPTEYEQVLSLPGIGRYTAGAILSIALNQPLPILEGNTIRVHARLHAISDDVSQTATLNQLWKHAQEAVEGGVAAGVAPSVLNQSLMELGASLCRVKQPRCHECPVQPFCQGARTGSAESLPINGRKMAFESRREGAIVVERRGKWLLRRCGDAERWAGLWDFPRYDVTEVPCVGTHLTESLQQASGLQVELQDTGWSTRHAVTRFRIELLVWKGIQVEGRLRTDKNLDAEGSQWNWYSLSELDELPLSVTGRAIAQRLEEFGS